MKYLIEDTSGDEWKTITENHIHDDIYSLLVPCECVIIMISIHSQI